MEKIKVLVLGGNGMLGHILSIKLNQLQNIELIRVFRGEDKLHIGQTHNIDVLNFQELEKLIQSLKPRFIINCIGLLVQQSQANKITAILTNSVLPNYLDELSQNLGLKLIHISTDCVFSGKEGPYKEDDLKTEDKVYGLTKNLGEIENTANLTVRTSIIGPELKGKSTGLFEWIKSQRNEIDGYSEVYWSGVTTLELSNFIISQIVEDIQLKGLYHFTNGVCISKLELIQLINNEFNFGLKINSNNIPKSNKCLLCTKNLNYSVSSYEKMIRELHIFMIENNHIYSI